MGWAVSWQEPLPLVKGPISLQMGGVLATIWSVSDAFISAGRKEIIGSKEIIGASQQAP